MCEVNAKTALVTGATGGIGKAIVQKLLDGGLSVAISGTNEERLNNLKAELGGGDNIHVLPCNLSDKEAAAGLIKQAEEALGGLDVFVCNAGITKDNLAMRMSADEFNEVISVNLEAPFILMKSCLRGMMKRKFGRIITIGSVVGTSGNPGQANYVASKAGLAGMVKSFALEVASRGITVNNIAPGFIQTAMTDKLTDDQKTGILQNVPLGELGQPEDIAGSVAFLMSQDARYITGQTLHVNGGMVMV